jgi:HEAT repeats
MDGDNRNPDDVKRPHPDSFSHEEHVEIWDLLGDIPGETPNSAAMRSRFDAALAEELTAAGSHRRRSDLRRRWPWPFAGHDDVRGMAWGLAAAAVVVLGVGIAIGRATSPTPQPDPSMAVLRQELHETRQMVALSLLQQQSASERLKGVSWTGQIEMPGSEVVAALLDTLVRDPNVNVRLASIDALKRFADQQNVRRAALDALNRQDSPLVQMALIDFMVEVNEREAVPELRRIAQDTMVNQAVRARATWSLQQIG